MLIERKGVCERWEGQNKYKKRDHRQKEMKHRIRNFLHIYGKTMLCMGILSVLLQAAAVSAHRSMLQQGIAKEVLRFHVLANSDSEADQAVKLKVRDRVLAWIAEQMEVTGKSEAQTGEKWENRTSPEKERQNLEHFLQTHLEEVTELADQELSRCGVRYTARTSLERCCFPERTYGDCTFPAGWYQALRIQLGEAKGHNWWCVLYPKLCFSDCLHAVVKDGEMEKLENVLTEEEYEYLIRNPKMWKIKFLWF